MKNLRQMLCATAIISSICAHAATPHSGTLPILRLNTENNQEITSKEVYLNATYYLESNDPAIPSIGSANDLKEVTIKARGNWTWNGFDKKPYKLKFNSKTEFMGMDKNKHFALLANADDNRGFMRNLVGFELSRRLGLPFTPMDSPLEYYLNGDYKGLYFCTQTIRIDKTRVNITEQNDNATENVDGGWLVEIDNYDTDPHVTVMEPNGYPIYFTYKSPEVLSNEQETYLTNQMTALNNAIYDSNKNSTTWQNLIDIESAARFYIVQEILDDCESYHGSCYLYKDKGENEKWHFGPVWDFGNAFQRGNKSKFIWQDPLFNQTWIGELYKYPAFQAKVKEIWKDFCDNHYAGLEDYIKEYASKIESASKFDFKRWPQYGHDGVSNKASDFISMIRISANWLGDQWGAKPSFTDPITEFPNVYVRGTFNNWETSCKMDHVGNGIYKIQNVESKGINTIYKIASEDWKTVDLGATEDNMSAEPEQNFNLIEKGKNINATNLAGLQNVNLVLDLNNKQLVYTQNSGTEQIEIPAGVATEIYTITGQKVNEMTTPGIYILKYGNKTVKIRK